MVGVTHEILTGDSLELMRQMQPGSFHAIITDPPYSSGGLYRADRVQTPITKYSSILAWTTGQNTRLRCARSTARVQARKPL